MAKLFHSALQHDFLAQHLVEVVEREVGAAVHVVDGVAGPQRGQHQPEHREGEQQADGDQAEHEEDAPAAGRQRVEEAVRGASAGKVSTRAHLDTSTQRLRMR